MKAACLPHITLRKCIFQNPFLKVELGQPRHLVFVLWRILKPRDWGSMQGARRGMKWWMDGEFLHSFWPRFTSHSNLLTQFKHPNEEFLREKTSDLLCFSGGIAFWVSFFLLSVESFQAQEPHFHPSFCRA